MTNSRWTNRIVGHGIEAPDQLLANPQNWRVHPKAQQDALSDLLDRVGWVQNVIVNQRTGHVVDGHLRVSLAINRQEKEIPVVYVDLSEEDEALVLASLDPLAAMAVTDQDMLAELMLNITAEGALADMLTDLLPASIKSGRTEPDAIPEQVEPRTQWGDLWLLGDHRVLCGDARDAAAWARLMNGEKGAMLWTDPPYGVSYVGKTARALTIANDGSEDLALLLSGAFRNVGEQLQPGAAFYIARPAGAQSVTFSNTVLDAGWQFHEELQWVKDSMVLGHSDYHVRHETIIYGWLPGQGRSGRGKHEGSRWFGGNDATTVFEVPRPKASREHPTMKPVALVEQMLLNSSQRGELVVDPFLGSGTTLMAAHRLSRRCYGTEIDPQYVDVIVARWEEYSGETAVRS